MNRKTYKIVSSIVCVLLVMAIVSLCAIAYFNSSSDTKNQTFTFVPVEISSNIDFVPKAPRNSTSVYDTQGYYISAQEVINEKHITYTPTITNNGEKDITAFMVVTTPYYINQNGNQSDILSLPMDQTENHHWLLVDEKTIKIDNNNLNHIYVFAYSMPLSKGQTTEPLCDYIISNVDSSFDFSIISQLNDSDYTKLDIQTSAIGIQSLEFNSSYESNKSYSLQELNQIWQTISNNIGNAIYIKN